MIEPTDTTIEIRCWECEHYEVGFQAMFEHILSDHPEYNQHEAEVFALEWMEGAYDRWDEQQQNYAKDSAYERKLNALRGKK